MFVLKVAHPLYVSSTRSPVPTSDSPNHIKAQHTRQQITSYFDKLRCDLPKGKEQAIIYRPK
jgi:hypothetical protein